MGNQPCNLEDVELDSVRAGCSPGGGGGGLRHPGGVRAGGGGKPGPPEPALPAHRSPTVHHGLLGRLCTENCFANCGLLNSRFGPYSCSSSSSCTTAAASPSPSPSPTGGIQV